MTQDLMGTDQYTPFNMVLQATVGAATMFYTYDGDGVRVYKGGANGVRYFVRSLWGATAGGVRSGRRPSPADS